MVRESGGVARIWSQCLTVGITMITLSDCYRLYPSIACHARSVAERLVHMQAQSATIPICIGFITISCQKRIFVAVCVFAEVSFHCANIINIFHLSKYNSEELGKHDRKINSILFLCICKYHMTLLDVQVFLFLRPFRARKCKLWNFVLEQLMNIFTNRFLGISKNNIIRPLFYLFCNLGLTDTSTLTFYCLFALNLRCSKL